MKCHACGSTSHLLRECPQSNQQQPQRTYNTTPTADTRPSHAAYAALESSGPLAGVLVPGSSVGGHGLNSPSVPGAFYGTSSAKEPVAPTVTSDYGLHFVTSGSASGSSGNMGVSDLGHASGDSRKRKDLSPVVSRSSGVIGTFEAS